MSETTPVEKSATTDFENDSSSTVSASSERSLEERQKRWKTLTERYRSAKYLAAKRKAALKRSDPFDITPRMSGRRGGAVLLDSIPVEESRNLCDKIRKKNFQPAAAEEVAAPKAKYKPPPAGGGGGGIPQSFSTSVRTAGNNSYL